MTTAAGETAGTLGTNVEKDSSQELQAKEEHQEQQEQQEQPKQQEQSAVVQGAEKRESQQSYQEARPGLAPVPEATTTAFDDVLHMKKMADRGLTLAPVQPHLLDPVYESGSGQLTGGRLAGRKWSFDGAKFHDPYTVLSHDPHLHPSLKGLKQKGITNPRVPSWLPNVFGKDVPFGMEGFERFGGLEYGDEGPGRPKSFWNNKGARVADNSGERGAAARKNIPFEGPDRFSLLLLEEGEYYFKDYSCYYHPQGGAQRVAGHLKVCSASLFFVPKNLHEPIFRMQYCHMSSIERAARPGSPAAGVGDFFVISATARTDMKIGNRNTPYAQHKGEFNFYFGLVFANLTTVLTRVNALLELARGNPLERSEKLAAIVDQHEQEVHFNRGWFEDPDETIRLELIGSRITPLVMQAGRIVLTVWSVYFQPFNVVSSAPVVRYRLDAVTSVMKRSSNLEETGVEIFFSDLDSVYFTFKSKAECQNFHTELLKQPGLSLQKLKSRERWTRDWVHGKVSNFDYLMYLNREANRSFNDLSQYPVFPWIIADYHSKKLDLKNPATFRDLSKPVGALNPQRLAVLKARYEDLEDAYEDWVQSHAPNSPPPHIPGTPTPPFLYGTHYSSPGYVVYFRVRDQPQLMLRLQNGRFDMPDRLLSSIQEMWEGVYTSATDLKELIPEFYALSPSFLVNSQDLDLGIKQTGQVVGDVKLPPWANSPSDFMQKMREALECPLVSRRLHKWIDLVFGYKQRGPAATAADNEFHPFTYDDFSKSVMDSVSDLNMREAIRVQMQEFGRTPRQLFQGAHPKQQQNNLQWLGSWLGSVVYSLKPNFLMPSARMDHDMVLESIRHMAKLKASQPAIDAIRTAKRTAYKRKFKFYHSVGSSHKFMKDTDAASRSVHRAIKRLAVPDLNAQREALDWLEQAVLYRDPSILEVSNMAYLAPLMPLGMSKKPEQRLIAMRALAVLAHAVPNRHLIVAAGFVEPIEVALFTDSRLAGNRAAIETVAMLSSEESLIATFSTAGTAALLSVLDPKSDRPGRQGISGVTVGEGFAAGSGVLTMTEAEDEATKWSQYERPPLAPGTSGDGSQPDAAAGTYRSPRASDRDILISDPYEERSLAAGALANLASLPRHRQKIVSGGGIAKLLRLCRPARGRGAELRENALRAVAALAVDPPIQEQVVEQGGLKMALKMCAEESGGQQEAAMWLLASLSTNEHLRFEIASEGGLRLLCNASCAGQKDVQDAAAEALGNLCADPTIINGVVREEGLWSVIAMAQSPNREVQRLAARAFWHLAVHYEDKRQVMAMGGLQSLLALAALGSRNQQATLLAEEALLKLTEDPEIQAQLEKEEAYNQAMVRMRGNNLGEERYSLRSYSDSDSRVYPWGDYSGAESTSTRGGREIESPGSPSAGSAASYSGDGCILDFKDFASYYPPQVLQVNATLQAAASSSAARSQQALKAAVPADNGVLDLFQPSRSIAEELFEITIKDDVLPPEDAAHAAAAGGAAKPPASAAAVASRQVAAAAAVAAEVVAAKHAAPIGGENFDSSIAANWGFGMPRAHGDVARVSVPSKSGDGPVGLPESSSILMPAANVTVAC